MPELPYVPFYCSDWLGDSKVRLLTFEQRGVYFDLLCHSWNLGPIPSNHGQLAALLGIPTRRFQALWPGIDRCWESNGNGGLLNPRLERERAKQATKRRAGSTGGKAGAKG